MRRGEVSIAGGYDGEYGVIKLFDAQERAAFTAQFSMFAAPKAPGRPKQERPSAQVAELPGTYKPESEAKSTPQLAELGPFSATALVLPPGGLRLSKVEGSASPPSAQWQQTDLFAAPQPRSDLLAGLNPPQREAAMGTDVPLVIVAGPGTGKTRTLTYRLAYLMTEQGVDPAHMLAITFTNKAAAEMATRLTALVGPAVAGRVVIKTFHAFGAMILREVGELAGLSPKFALAGDSDRRTLLKRLDPEWSDKEINAVLEQISAAKNQLLTPDTVDLPGFPNLAGLKEMYRAYEAVLQQNHLLDFDDLILRPVKLFERLPEVLETYRQRFRWISVDEYQDINLAQYRLLRLLTTADTNLCAIGDPDQAIYGFRGASHEYFLKFRADFPHARIIHLSQNYRSTQLILDASSQVIAQSPAERVKIWSEFLDQTRLDIYRAPTDKAEAEYVVHQIEKMVGGTSYFSLDSERVTAGDDAGRSFADFAVLYRLNAQSQPLIEAFQRSGIPFQTAGLTSLYEQKEIKTILACLWFICNPASTFHLEQVVSKKGLKNLVAFLNDLRPTSTAQPVARLIEPISQYLSLDLDEKRAERVRQLIRRAVPFEDRLADFLESTSLQKETDAYDPRADRVALMTLHAAKGLEFPVVFMVGCEENLLPFQMEGRPFDLAEERRLFYVGMTRAQYKLILTHAKSRFLFGQKQQNKPSRFLNDIENTLKEIKKMAARPPVKEKPDSPQLKLF
jgi:DNA helicase-2/ATP-dependent DNA helicase PcrA